VENKVWGGGTKPLKEGITQRKGRKWSETFLEGRGGTSNGRTNGKAIRVFGRLKSGVLYAHCRWSRKVPD